MVFYILFVVGFFILIKGANLVLDGASSLAKRLKISDLTIGLTIVAFGTSAPELIVSLIASLRGNTDIVIGNILGSNIFNTLLILGTSAIIYPLSVGEGTIWKEIPFGLLATIMIGILANDVLIDKNNFSGLTRIDGLVLIAFFLIFMVYIFDIAKLERQKYSPTQKSFSILKSSFFIGGGLFCLFFGGNWVVKSAVQIAKMWRVSETLIALTIVAAGTSFPELATSAVAAYKRNCEIAVGNIVGSNIFNVFFVLGAAAVLKPLPFKFELNLDILVNILCSLLLLLWMFVGKKHIMEKWQGVSFIFLYFIYLVFLIHRQ